MKKIALITLWVFFLVSCDSDNDTGPGVDDPITVSFVTDSYSIVEGDFENEQFIINLMVSGGITAEDATVDIASDDVIGLDFYDFQFLNRITIPPGDYRSEEVISYVFYVLDDCEVESNKSFEFRLENPSVDWLNIGTQNETTIDLEDDDVDVSDFLTGNIYDRTNFIIENQVDLNNDGIFSFDIDLETDCSSAVYFFIIDSNNGDGCAKNFSGIFGLVADSDVAYDANDNPFQTTQCLIADGDSLRYEINGNFIDFTYNNTVQYTGEFSDNFSILTITIPNDYLIGNSTYLLEDGTVTNYTGNVTAIYELRE